MNAPGMEPTAEHWDDVWTKSRPLAPHDTVLATISRLPITSVLEIGAGSGRDLAELHDRGYEVIFSDFSLVAAKRFSEDNKLGPQVLLADCRSLPFRDDSFDLVFSLGLLEHFESGDREKIIREKFRVAKKYVLIDVPQTLSLATIVKKALIVMRRWPYDDNETQFTFAELMREIRRVEGRLPIVAQYGRELIPLPRNAKWILYSRLPRSIKRTFLWSHTLFARVIAGSFGVVLAKERELH